FSIILALVYLSISIFIGSIAKNRWQALIGGITVWFLTIIAWPLLMISTLSQLPSYKTMQPALQIFTLLNPAKLARVYSIMSIGTGSAFGADNDKRITWTNSNNILLPFALIFI